MPLPSLAGHSERQNDDLSTEFDAVEVREN